MVKAAVAGFTAAVNSAKSMTQLLANPAFMNVLMTANGMGDQIGYTALATKALTLEDPCQELRLFLDRVGIVPEAGDDCGDRKCLHDGHLGNQPG
jgi:hypothetical protein